VYVVYVDMHKYVVFRILNRIKELKVKVQTEVAEVNYGA
jgi:hypothetical protein